VDLVVAGRVEEHTVVDRLVAAMGSPNDMMVVPAGEFGDFLVANRAETVLFLPQVKQLAALSEIMGHFEA
jgi:hypothetical protein